MKALLISFLFLLASTSSKAQEEETSPFTYGVKFGLPLSELKGSDNLKSLRTSFLAGLISEYELSEKYSLALELLYSRQGATNRGNVEGSFFENRLNLDYFNMPVLVKYDINQGLALEVGPQFGYLLKGTYESKQLENPIKTNVEDDFEAYDLSVALGASFKTEWGFLVGARYNLGLNDINKRTDLESGSLNNAVFQLYFGYLFE